MEPESPPSVSNLLFDNVLQFFDRKCDFFISIYGGKCDFFAYLCS